MNAYKHTIGVARRLHALGIITEEEVLEILRVKDLEQAAEE